MTCGASIARLPSAKTAPTPIRQNPISLGFCRAEMGTHHRISGRYLNRYASEIAWREDRRRVPNGTRTIAGFLRLMTKRVSVALRIQKDKAL
jgi:hypothetical protein